MTRDELPAIFTACCSPPDAPGRYAIHEPFFHGYAYATDGQIMVRTPCDPFDSPRNTPDAAVLFKQSLDGLRSEKPTKLPKPPAKWSTCDDCGHEHKCAEEHWQPVKVGKYVDGRPAYIRANYVLTLLKHGVTEVCWGEPGRPAYFTVGNVEGLVMPVEPDQTCK